MMRSAVLWAIASWLILSAYPPSAKALPMDECDTWANYAHLTMKMRQDGVPIRSAISAAMATHEATNSDQVTREIVKEIILGAYRAPLEPTERMAMVAAIRFSEEVFTHCVTSWGE